MLEELTILGRIYGDDNKMLVNNIEVIENRDIQCLSYVLSDSDVFLYTSYKVLKSHEDNGFVKCNKVSFNGKDKLIYDIEKYKSLDCILQTINFNTFSVIMSNFLKIVLQVKENGFMKCENLDLQVDKIFVDINSCNVYLIYLPIESSDSDSQKNYAMFEVELRKMIYGILTMNRNIINEVTLYIRNNISNSRYTLYDILESLNYNNHGPNTNGFNSYQYNRMNYAYTNANPNISKIDTGNNLNTANNSDTSKGKFWSHSKKNKVSNKEKNKIKNNKKNKNVGTNVAVLKGVNTYIEILLNMNKSEFIIGKKVDKVDFAIVNNSTVSRIHCKVIIKNGMYYIVDLGSINGTFVNGTRISAYQAVPINIGDNIAISNLQFVLNVLHKGE